MTTKQTKTTTSLPPRRRLTDKEWKTFLAYMRNEGNEACTNVSGDLPKFLRNRFRNLEVPVVENLDLKILQKALKDEDSFNMSYWHESTKDGEKFKFYNYLSDSFDWKKYEKALNKKNYCGTTHCRAGWACVFGGAVDLEVGQALQNLEALAKAKEELGDEYFEEDLEADTINPTPAIAAMIYIASTGKVPNFYADTYVAIDEMKETAIESLVNSKDL